MHKQHANAISLSRVSTPDCSKTWPWKIWLAPKAFEPTWSSEAFLHKRLCANAAMLYLKYFLIPISTAATAPSPSSQKHLGKPPSQAQASPRLPILPTNKTFKPNWQKYRLRTEGKSCSKMFLCNLTTHTFENRLMFISHKHRRLTESTNGTDKSRQCPGTDWAISISEGTGETGFTGRAVGHPRGYAEPERKFEFNNVRKQQD